MLWFMGSALLSSRDAGLLEPPERPSRGGGRNRSPGSRSVPGDWPLAQPWEAEWPPGSPLSPALSALRLDTPPPAVMPGTPPRVGSATAPAAPLSCPHGLCPPPCQSLAAPEAGRGSHFLLFCRLVAALSVTLALFAVELAGFFLGVSMFNSTQSLICILSTCTPFLLGPCPP